MAVNTTGVSPAANFLPTVWSQHVSDATQATVVLSELVDRKFEAEMRFGRIINIQDMSNPAVRFKTEDATATWANITETRQAITINRQVYSAFLVEDIAELQSNIDLRGKYTAKLGYVITATIEGDLTSGMASLPSSFSQLYGTLGQDPTDDDWLSALQALEDGDVPDRGRFIYASPATYLSFLKQEKFTSQLFVGQSSAERAIKEAMVGQIYGAKVYKSSLANNNPSAANQSYSWFGHPEGVTLIMQMKPKTHVDRVILEDSWGVFTTAIYQFAERLIPPSTLGGSTSNDRFSTALRGA